MVAHELRAHGFDGARPVEGGAVFTGDLREAARANLHLCCATRILLRVGEFLAPGRRELLRGARELDWSPYLRRGEPVAIRVTCHKSRLYHTGLVAEVLREALGVSAAEATEEGESDAPMLHVRIVRDLCTLSLDTSGALLHRRGWREEQSRAPLRETLAAGLLRIARWEGNEAFVDPMCGSGTIAIEAALMAARRAPGIDRSFALENFPSFDRAVLQELRARAQDDERTVEVPIVASDVHFGALNAASRNAERARVADFIEFRRADVGGLEAPTPTGLLITNPPYGRRLPTHRNGADPSLQQLASALRGPFAQWRRFVLGPSNLRSSLRLPIASARALTNGGLRVELMELEKASPNTQERIRR